MIDDDNDDDGINAYEKNNDAYRNDNDNDNSDDDREMITIMPVSDKLIRISD